MRKMITKTIEEQQTICDICGAVQPEIGLQNRYLMFMPFFYENQQLDLCQSCLHKVLDAGYKKLKNTKR